MAQEVRSPASLKTMIASIAVIVCVVVCIVGCDELGLNLGPGTMPKPTPLDQTAAAAVPGQESTTEAPVEPNSESDDATSPTIGSSRGDGKADSDPKTSDRERLKSYREWTVAETAIDSLGRLGEQAVPPLIESLDDPNPLVRYRAAKVLSRIGPDAVEAVPALVRHLSDVDESVRREAARAIGQIGPDASEAVPHLINALKSDG